MDDVRFIEMVKRGELLRVVGVAFGLTPSAVIYHMDRLGLKRRNRSKVRLKPGDHIGEWELLSRRVERGRGMWLCRCSCGAESEVEAGKLGANRSTRCKGCCDLWAKRVVVPDRYWTMLAAAAKKRSKVFEITQEYAGQLLVTQQYRCALTNEPIAFAESAKEQRVDLATTASLDRKDSALGYVAGNVWWVHKIVNWMKGPLPNEQFVEYCCKVAAHAGRSSGVAVGPDAGTVGGDLRPQGGLSP